MGRSIWAALVAVLVVGLAGKTLAATPAHASATINSVDKIVYDMQCCHEGHPHGVPTSYHWYNSPDMGAGNNPPSGYTALLAWGQVYYDSSNTDPPNLRVQLRNIELFLWSKSRQQWIRLDGPTVPSGAHFYEDFHGPNANVPANVRSEPDGGISATMQPGYNFHFWGKRASITPADIGGVFSTYQARLILDNPAGPDNRSAARFIADAGADYKGDMSGSTSTECVLARFGYLTSDWKAFNSHTWTESQIRQNPPPIDGQPLSSPGAGGPPPPAATAAPPNGAAPAGRPAVGTAPAPPVGSSAHLPATGTSTPLGASAQLPVAPTPTADPASSSGGGLATLHRQADAAIARPGNGSRGSLLPWLVAPALVLLLAGGAFAEHRRRSRRAARARDTTHLDHRNDRHD